MRLKSLLIFSTFMISCAPVPSYRYLCSETLGQVTQNGIPIENALVKRKNNSAWYNNHETDITYSDRNGFFRFPSATRISLFYILHQPVISQIITISHNGNEYLGWQFTKMNYDKNGEVSRPLELSCDLNNENKRHKIYISNYEHYTGICIHK